MLHVGAIVWNALINFWLGMNMSVQELKCCRRGARCCSSTQSPWLSPSGTCNRIGRLPARPDSGACKWPTLGYMGYMGYTEYRHETSVLCDSNCGQLKSKIRSIFWLSSSRSSKQAASVETNCLQPVRTQTLACQSLKKGVAVHFERNYAYNSYNRQIGEHLLTELCYHWWPAGQELILLERSVLEAHDQAATGSRRLGTELADDEAWSSW